MNPEFPIDPRKALEASLTALLVGELPDDQARFLRQAIATDPELAKTFERLKRTTELVHETLASPPRQPVSQAIGPRLSDQRREALLQRFKTVSPAQFAQPVRRRASWLVPAAAAAVFLIGVAGALLPALSKSKNKSMALHDLRNSNNLEGLKRMDSRSELAAGRSSPERLREALRNSGNPSPSGQTEEFAFSKQTPAQVTLSASPQSLASVPEQTRIVLPNDNKSDSSILGASVESGANRVWSLSAGNHSLLDENSRIANSTFSTFAFGTGSAGGGGIGGGGVPVLGDVPSLGRRYLSESKDAKASVVASR